MTNAVQSGDGNRPVPAHVAVIMDGNGRWAEARGLPRLRGHEAGAESVRAVLQACREAGVRVLTLYAFSVENWKRPAAEIEGLSRLLVRFLGKYEKELHDHRIRVRTIGRLGDFNPSVQRALDKTMRATESYTEHQLVLALSYGGRAEIADAVRAIARRVRDGDLAPDAIDEHTVAEHLYAPDLPDPDLMIRTSGEMRLSNFLLWQLSYAELYVTPILWPDFREAAFLDALRAYGDRQRRFGGLTC